MNLSGSTDGKPIKIAAAGSPGTTVHTATSSATPGAGGTWDEIWLWCYSSVTVTDAAGSFLVRVQWGGTTSPDNLIEITVPNQCGAFLLVAGLLLQNSAVVKVYSGVANKTTIMGFVNRITN